MAALISLLDNGFAQVTNITYEEVQRRLADGSIEHLGVELYRELAASSEKKSVQQSKPEVKKKKSAPIPEGE